MADRLNGYRILILETREEAQFSRLLTEQGADVLQCPMFTIHDAPDPAPVEAWIGRYIDRPYDDLMLMTGEGLRRIMKVVRRLDVETAFVAALRQSRKFCRGLFKVVEATKKRDVVSGGHFVLRRDEASDGDQRATPMAVAGGDIARDVHR